MLVLIHAMRASNRTENIQLQVHFPDPSLQDLQHLSSYLISGGSVQIHL